MPGIWNGIAITSVLLTAQQETAFYSLPNRQGTTFNGSTFTAVNASSFVAVPSVSTGIPTLFPGSAEQFATLPVENGSSPPSMYAVYSCLVTSAQIGDVYRFDASFEISNKNSFTVGIGCFLTRGQSGSDVGGVPLTPRMLEDVMPDAVHRIYTRWAWDTNWSGAAYYNVVVYCIATPADPSLNSVILEAGYGKVTVARFR